jgi:hypothetical protein
MNRQGVVIVVCPAQSHHIPVQKAGSGGNNGGMHPIDS